MLQRGLSAIAEHLLSIHGTQHARFR